MSTGSLQFRASGSYTDGIYTSFPRSLIYIPLPAGGNAQAVGEGAGNQIINTPKFTSSVGLDYSVPAGSLGTMAFTATWAHNSGFFWDSQNRLKEPAYDLVNGQISLTAPDESWRVRLFARNLLDQQYYAYVSASPTGDTGAAAAPRTYGIAVGFKF
jgi:iron complex outermembrane receptor protein